MPQENKDGMLAISVYLTPEQYDWLSESAKADHRSRASLVRKIIAAAHEGAMLPARESFSERVLRHDAEQRARDGGR